MRSTFASLAGVALLAGVLSPSAYAQKGVGDATGVAQQPTKPELVTFSGEIVVVETKPCEKTTGHSLVGTHILLKTEKDTALNIHLGWAEAVEEIAKQLPVGKKVTVTAFRTDKMPEGQYVAKSLTYDDKTVQLRDENLRPLWAGIGNGQRGLQQPAGQGRGGDEDRVGEPEDSVAPSDMRLGGRVGVSPFGALMALNYPIKDYWEREPVTAPTPHAEELSLGQLAGKMGLPIEQVIDALKQEGIAVEDDQITVAQLAEKNRLTPSDVYAAIKKCFPEADQPRQGKGRGKGQGLGEGKGGGFGLGKGQGRGMGRNMQD